MQKFLANDLKIAVVGLGYVGLPLAIEFAKKFDVVGFDLSDERIRQIKNNEDRTSEVGSEDLMLSTCTFSDQVSSLNNIDVFIICVPTPVDTNKTPDFSSLIASSEIVGKKMRCNALVVYESTVYPGATLEICVPILEKCSGLLFNKEFFVGYSPERVNPGDPSRKIKDIVKVTSGSTVEAGQFVDELYGEIISAGTYKAESIEVAEAAKVIENIQRDVNIALINELAMLFEAMGLDTKQVLNAASTKWNFLNFHPGLVGGHCIGVDPYYLMYKAQKIGFHSEIITVGRRLNDSMTVYVAERFEKMLRKVGLIASGQKVLIMGVTFKENCPDIRNSKVIELIADLQGRGFLVDVYDPLADDVRFFNLTGIKPIKTLSTGAYIGVLVAVRHEDFYRLCVVAIRKLLMPKGILFDLKSMFPKEAVDDRL